VLNLLFPALSTRPILRHTALVACVLMLASGCNDSRDRQAIEEAEIKLVPVVNGSHSKASTPIIVDEPGDPPFSPARKGGVSQKVLPPITLERGAADRARLTYVANASNARMLLANEVLALDSNQIVYGGQLAGALNIPANGDTLKLLWIDEAGRVAASQVYVPPPGINGGTFTFKMPESAFGHRHKIALVRIPANGNVKVEAVETFRVNESMFWDDYVVLSNTALPPPPAAPTITLLTNLSNTDPGVPADEHTVVDFDHPNAPGFTFTGGFVRPGSDGLWPGVSAPPPGDLTNYETTSTGQVATLTSLHLLKTFSFYLGSPDSYNSVEFIGLGFDWLLNGDAIWGGVLPPGDGNQSHGLRVRYDFNGNPVNKIVFSSSGNSFEFDTLAAGGVPEPAAWSLMIAGFGAMGAMLRRRRAVVLAAA